MTHFANRGLHETLTYWAPTGVPIGSAHATNEFGFVTTSVGVLVKGRWEDKITNVRKPTGEEITTMAQVYLSSSVEVDGYLARGNFEDQALAPNHEAHQIQAYHETPDLRNLGHERRAFL